MPVMHALEFKNKHPDAHLVVAEYDPFQAITEDCPTRLELLIYFAAALGTADDYTGIDKEADAVIYMAFAVATDASRFAEAFQAKRTAEASGWASMALFTYDFETYDNIRKSLE